jgi:hypothetical protein
MTDRRAPYAAVLRQIPVKYGEDAIEPLSPDEVETFIDAILPVVDAEVRGLLRKLATSERIRENADFHLGQEMARRQAAEKETERLRAELAKAAR